MSGIATFKIPESVEDAHERIFVLKQEISVIGLQLVQPKVKSEEPGWRRSAQTALTWKRQEKAFLQFWLRKNASEQKTKAQVTVGTIPNLADHLRIHSKLMGRLGNLFIAAEDHIANDCDESFETLASEVEKIRELLSDELE